MGRGLEPQGWRTFKPSVICLHHEFCLRLDHCWLAPSALGPEDRTPELPSCFSFWFHCAYIFRSEEPPAEGGRDQVLNRYTSPQAEEFVQSGGQREDNMDGKCNVAVASLEPGWGGHKERVV